MVVRCIQQALGVVDIVMTAESVLYLLVPKWKSLRCGDSCCCNSTGLYSWASNSDLWVAVDQSMATIKAI